MRFFDGETELGPGLPGFGNTWSLVVPWNPAVPEIRRIRAVAEAEGGASDETPVAAFLLADPSSFVPLSDAGQPVYGAVLPLDATGQLGAFRYYPEGLGESARSTGMHFEFAAGAQATLNSPVTIRFTDGTFFRGPERRRTAHPHSRPAHRDGVAHAHRQ